MFQNNHLVKSEILSILARFKKILGVEKFNKKLEEYVSKSSLQYFKDLDLNLSATDA